MNIRSYWRYEGLFSFLLKDRPAPRPMLPNTPSFQVQTLSKEDTVRLLKQLQAILFEGYSLTHKLTHTRYVLNRFSNEDLDNDGQLTLREFVRVIRAFNVQLSDAEIEALFNVFCQVVLGLALPVHGTPLFALSPQSFLCSSRTLGRRRAWQFPLRFMAPESAHPPHVSCPPPHRRVGQSQDGAALIPNSERFVEYPLASGLRQLTMARTKVETLTLSTPLL